jgi:ribonuclease HI
MIEAWFDGAVEPMNPGGHGGYGALVKRAGQLVFSEAVYIGRWPALSNNVAEYCGAIGVLRYLLREGITEGTVYGDADIVINQINGKWNAKSGAYIPYYKEAYSLRVRVPKVKFIWIPRERNCEADELSKEAVTRRPLTVTFALDSSVGIITAPKAKKKRKRTREVLRLDLNKPAVDDAWEMFKLRHG